MRFAICPLHLCKVLRLPCKSDARSYELLHLSRKIILANLKIWCSKMHPLSRNQRPDLLTSLMNMSLVLRLPREMHLSRSSSNVPRMPSLLELLQNPHVLLTFGKVQNPLHMPRKTRSEPSKMVRTCGALCILTWTCALGSILSTSQRPKVARTWGVFYILTSKFASRHNGVGVQFFFSHLARWLRTCRFSKPTFRPYGTPEPQIIGKTECFAHLHLRSSESFSSLFFSLLSSSLLFSDSSHLCFSICPYCRKFDFQISFDEFD